MDYTPQEVQLLTKTLPGIAAQLRGALANMHAALSSGDTPDACILRQSYYRLLRTVTNLTEDVYKRQTSTSTPRSPPSPWAFSSSSS